MNFMQTFEGPVIEKIDGKEIKFPALLIEDYMPWCAELTQKRRTVARQKLPRDIDSMSRWKLEQQIEALDVGLADIGEQVWTLNGARRVLQISLSKAGHDEKDSAALIGRIKPHRLHSLAIEVSALFERKAIPKEQPDPNEQTVSQNSSESTGSLNGLPLPDGQDATRAA